jgi:protein SCO1/2
MSTRMATPMRRPDRSRRAWLRGALGAPLAGMAAAVSNAGTGVEPALPSPRERIRDRHLPNVPVRAHDGRLFRFYDDLICGKVVVINFMYTQCEGICPGVTMNLAKVQRLLGARVGRDVFMYSITLDPAHDTKAALAAYAREHGARPGWRFLTGAPADLERLRRSLGFVDPDPEVDRDRENHIGNVRYGNEPRMLWAACPGMADAKWIAEALVRVMV